MSYANRGLNAYKQQQVQSRSPLELVVMLYDGALRFAGEAREAIERGDIAARRDKLDRTLAIITELQSTLNLEEGGEVAANLAGLYDFMSRRLLDAAIQNSVEPLDEVRGLLETIRDAWRTLATAPAGPHDPATAQPVPPYPTTPATTTASMQGAA
ncbi:MAG: flagellar export chaperone FliS [Acidobacteria bacterium]|nr:flagellar export chaperone FliS [Acidobacteriota bacterium]